MTAKCRPEKERRFILFKERGISDPTLADIVLIQCTIYTFNLDCSTSSGSQSQLLRHLLRPCFLESNWSQTRALDFLGEGQQIKQLQRPQATDYVLVVWFVVKWQPRTPRQSEFAWITEENSWFFCNWSGKLHRSNCLWLRCRILPILSSSHVEVFDFQ